MIKKIVLASLVLMWVLPGIRPADAKKYDYFMGSTQSSSSYYANTITWAKVINTYTPDVHVTVVESGATYNNLDRTRNGEFQLSTPSAYSGIIESYYGLARYKGKPDPSLRMICISNPFAVLYMVRKDSGVTDIKGLDGKNFFAGPIGHISGVATEKVFDKFGIHPKYFVGGFADAVTAMQDNRIVGFSKTAAGRQLDSSMIQVSSVIPCRLLGWTPEMVDYVVKVIPGAVGLTIEKGGVDAMPDAGPLNAWGMVITFFTTKDLPEEAAYQIIKAVDEHWASDIAPNFAPCKSVKVLQDSVKLLSAPETPVPLHPGVIKYLREKGIEVPQKLIPPSK